ncbi:hypothetical protein [Butyrivibrio sp. MC2021]|uniref:hypothetical protein n=1 Tax=Butyrivibrio sp. MC2021 TaxID=1408306 RepID=UPI00047A132F|nr:hypothetical protein [Butyrivibrio sp. MC2021]
MIAYEEYYSIEELMIHYQKCNDMKMFLGSIDSKNARLCIITIRGNVNCKIAIANKYPIKPRCVKKNKLLFVGYNDQVDIISDKQLVASEREFCFYDLLDCNDKIIAIFEIGIICLTSDGSLLWRFDVGDIVSNFYVSGDVLCIETFEGVKMRINVSNGQLLK